MRRSVDALHRGVGRDAEAAVRRGHRGHRGVRVERRGLDGHERADAVHEAGPAEAVFTATRHALVVLPRPCARAVRRESRACCSSAAIVGALTRCPSSSIRSMSDSGTPGFERARTTESKTWIGHAPRLAQDGGPEDLVRLRLVREALAAGVHEDRTEVVRGQQLVLVVGRLGVLSVGAGDVPDVGQAGAQHPGHSKSVAGVADAAVRHGGGLVRHEELEKLAGAREPAAGEDDPRARGEVSARGSDADHPGSVPDQPIGRVRRRGSPRPRRPPRARGTRADRGCGSGARVRTVIPALTLSSSVHAPARSIAATACA